MLKKKARVFMDPAPSTSVLIGEETRARFKHQCLLQDYQELLKEAEEKRERLIKTVQRKLMLLAEVKFLSKKYQSLSSNSKGKPCRVKRQSFKQAAHSSFPVMGTKPPSKRTGKSKEASVQSSKILAEFNQFKVPFSEKNLKAKEASVPSSPRLLDLNQVSFPNGKEMEEFEVKWEPLKIDKLKRSLNDGDAIADDFKFSICRDFGSSSLSNWGGIGYFHGKISSL